MRGRCWASDKSDYRNRFLPSAKVPREASSASSIIADVLQLWNRFSVRISVSVERCKGPFPRNAKGGMEPDRTGWHWTLVRAGWHGPGRVGPDKGDWDRTGRVGTPDGAGWDWTGRVGTRQGGLGWDMTGWDRT